MDSDASTLVNEGLRRSSVQQLYVLAKNWRSETDFYHDELLVLKKKVDQHFVWATKEDSLALVGPLVRGVALLEHRCSRLSNCIAQYITHIEDQLEKTWGVQHHVLKSEHLRIGAALRSFQKDISAFKNELLSISRHISELEQ